MTLVPGRNISFEGTSHKNSTLNPNLAMTRWVLTQRVHVVIWEIYLYIHMYIGLGFRT